MYFKAKFVDVIDEDFPAEFKMSIDSNSGREIIKFQGHEFEVDRDNLGNIEEITFCSQCVNTYNIEETFLELLLKILKNEQLVILFDSNGMEDKMTKDDLEELIS